MPKNFSQIFKVMAVTGYSEKRISDQGSSGKQKATKHHKQRIMHHESWFYFMLRESYLKLLLGNYARSSASNTLRICHLCHLIARVDKKIIIPAAWRKF